jgi:hypothetical protein
MNNTDPTSPTAVNASNEHVIGIARGVLRLPRRALHAMLAIWSLVTRQLTTQRRLDNTDELRQSRVRRQLRGLPPDHDPAGPRPPK